MQEKNKKKEMNRKEILNASENHSDRLEEGDQDMMVGGMTLRDRCTQSYSVGICHLTSLDGACPYLIFDMYEANGLLKLDCSKGYFKGATIVVGLSNDMLKKITKNCS